jgi:branched-chain amino acid transport system permease protein
MDILLQQIINGLVLGSMYALIALGYTMVYGIIQLINFAHGEVLMVGALTAGASSAGCRPRCPAAHWIMLLLATLAGWWPTVVNFWSRRSPTGRCATRRAWRR